MHLFYKAGVVLNYIEAFIAVSARSHNMSQKDSLPIVAEIKPSKLGRSPKNSLEQPPRTRSLKLMWMSRFVDFHQLYRLHSNTMPAL